MKKLIIFISSIILTVFSVPTFANLEGVAVIDYQAIFLGTDLARTSLDELRESEDYKELMEEVQLKDSERLAIAEELNKDCLLYTSPSPRDSSKSRMPSSA